MAPQSDRQLAAPPGVYYKNERTPLTHAYHSVNGMTRTEHVTPGEVQHPATQQWLSPWWCTYRHSTHPTDILHKHIDKSCYYVTGTMAGAARAMRATSTCTPTHTTVSETLAKALGGLT